MEDTLPKIIFKAKAEDRPGDGRPRMRDGWMILRLTKRWTIKAQWLAILRETKANLKVL
jgi:type II secretory pathway component PulL